MSAFQSFVVKETRHILRDRQTLAVLLAMPVAMVLLFGYAIRTDMQDVRLVVVDASRDARSADLTRALASTTALRLVGVRASAPEVEPMLRRGEADVALLLPPRFGQALARGTAEVLVVSDGANATYAATAEAYVRAVVQRWAQRRLGGSASAGAPLAPAARWRCRSRRGCVSTRRSRVRTSSCRAFWRSCSRS